MKTLKKILGFFKDDDNVEALFIIAIFLTLVVGIIYSSIQVRKGDYEKNYCEMVVKVYYTPTNVKTMTFRNNLGLKLKSRKGTNIISDGVGPLFRTSAPIEVVSYTEERATKNERKRNGKWY